MALILKPGPETTLLAAQALRAGAVIIFPTETVYGIGCDLRDEPAIRRLFAIKQRPPDMPLMAHCADWAQVTDWVQEIPDRARPLMARFWPGPLALVLKRGPNVPDTAVAGGRTIGIRLVANPVAAELIRHLGAPIAGTSANISSEPATADFRQLSPKLLAQVDIALDAGTAGLGQPSTVLDVTGDPPRLIRAGAVPVAEIEKILGCPVRPV